MDRIIYPIFAHHFLQSFNVGGSKGRRVTLSVAVLDTRDVASCSCCFSLILCLFKALFKGEAIFCFVLYSSRNASLFCKGGFPVMAETTRNHIFSKEISQVIIAAMVLAPNLY